MHAYRRKPLVIEAFQMTADRAESRDDWPEWLEEAYQKGLGYARDVPVPAALRCFSDGDESEVVIDTPRGQVAVNEDDWIIRATADDLYPCPPKLFADTYENIPKGTGIAEQAPTTGMGFGRAIAWLQDGRRVARQGWNGKGMYLFHVPAGARFGGFAAPADDNGDLLEATPFIAMKAADNTIVPWLASQTDILATDWEIA